MRFIHLSDVHLGAVPDRGYPWSVKREEEIWNSFRRLMGDIRSDPVDVIFIAGNLFCRQPLKRELEEVSSLFESLEETRIYLMAGPRDSLTPTSFYLEQEWPSNVFFFPGDGLVRKKDPVLPLYVYGESYTQEGAPSDLWETGAWEDEEMPEEALHVLMGRAEDAPEDVRPLVRGGYDFVALGEEGSPQIFLRDKALSCGSFEPMEPSDEGERGYFLGWQMEGRIRTRFVPYASRTYRRVDIEVNEEDTRFSVEDKVKEKIHALGAGNIYTIHLQGRSSLEQLFFFDRLKRLGNVLELQDETKPAYELERVYRTYRGTLLGDFLESFFAREGEAFDEESLSPEGKKALFYGLQALLETAGES